MELLYLGSFFQYIYFFMKSTYVPLPWEALKWCPRCGSDTLVRKESNALQCETCDYHHFFNAAAAVIALIRNEKGELLVTKRAFEPYKGMLDFPGGFVMPDESAESALKRELMEELNLEVNSLKFICTHSNRYPFSDVIVFTMDLIFEVEITDFGVLKTGDDVSAYQFLSEDQLRSELFGITSVKKIVEQIILKSVRKGEDEL